MKKIRIDNLLVENGLASSVAKAKSMVLAGEVYVGSERIDKAGHQVAGDSKIEIKKKSSEYVSRGGLKLIHALREFKLDINNCVCIDIGVSTGGFTDCLLKNGAKKVYAIDVGYGQLDYRLRNDKRVVVLEKTNIRELEIERIEEDVDLVTIDVSFIGLEKVFPKVNEILKSGQVIALIKPQFQVEKGKVGKGGVVRDESLRKEAIEAVKCAASKFEWECRGVIPSPITGPKGNIEYLAYFTV